jgi:putative molybdopterin biosynthesis protein
VICIPRTFDHSKLMPMSQAVTMMLETFPKLGSQETIKAIDIPGRILASPVYSNRTNPPHFLSGPDGIAVVSSQTTGATKETPVEVNGPRVNTGLPLPDGFDAVVPMEEVIHISEDRYRIHIQVTPYQNTIPAGSDVEKGDLVMEAGHLFIPYDIGALLTYGIREVSVKSWKIGIIATGDEIVPPDKNPLFGQIVDSNSYVIAAYLKQFGIIPVIAPVIPDDLDAISEELTRLCETCDMVLLFGGSSAGSKDFTADALKESGTLLFHGVSMAPGKPVSLANVNGKPIFGMPGPSIGALIILYKLVYPLLRQWGAPIPEDTFVNGELTAPVSSFGGFDMFLLVSAHQHEGKMLITPVERRFGQMMGVRANAIIHIPSGTPTIESGTKVQVLMIRS